MIRLEHNIKLFVENDIEAVRLDKFLQGLKKLLYQKHTDM